ncbi:hypothetical protein Vretimale_8223, partial [Volvox reticuliferus]
DSTTALHRDVLNPTQQLVEGGAGDGTGEGGSPARKQHRESPPPPPSPRPPNQRQGQQRGSKTAAGKSAGVPAPVHRLGRGTSGLLLCARTPLARRALTELMTGKTAAAAAAAESGKTVRPLPPPSLPPQQQLSGIPLSSETTTLPPPPPPPPLRKIYRALVRGIVLEDQGRVDVPIGPISHPGVDGGLFAATPTGKPAASLWRVLERRWGPALTTSTATATAAAAGALPSLEGCYPRAVAAAAAGAGAEGLAAAAAAAAALTPTAVTCLVGSQGSSQPSSPQPPLQQQQPAGLCSSQEAKTEAEEGGDCWGQTLMQVEILTGRPHQIRIHMAAMGHPLLGDPLYGIGGRPRVGLDSAALANAVEETALTDPRDGGFGRPGDCGYHLHSLELQFPHPTTGQLLLLRAPPPPLLMTSGERQQQEEQHRLNEGDGDEGNGGDGFGGEESEGLRGPVSTVAVPSSWRAG